MEGLMLLNQACRSVHMAMIHTAKELIFHQVDAHKALKRYHQEEKLREYQLNTENKKSRRQMLWKNLLRKSLISTNTNRSGTLPRLMTPLSPPTMPTTKKSPSKTAMFNEESDMLWNTVNNIKLVMGKLPLSSAQALVATPELF